MGIINSLIKVFQLNESFFIYMAVFFIFLFLISRFLLNPYLHAFEKRDEKTQGRLLLVSQIQEENKALTKQYKQKLVGFNQRFQEKLEDKKKELGKKNISEINQARKNSQKWIEEQRQVFLNDFNKAKKEIQTKALRLAKELTSKLIS